MYLSAMTDDAAWPVVEIGDHRIRVSHAAAGSWQHAVDGTWEPATVAAINALMSEGSIFIDVGAYVGVLSGLALIRGATVHAFEPDPVALDSLNVMAHENPELSRRLTVHPVALGTSNSRMSLSSDALGNSGSSLLRKGPQSVEVEVQDMRSLLDSAPFDKCNVIKIDVEGAEYGLLPHIWDYLMRQRPALILSTHTYFVRERMVGLPRLIRGPLWRLRAIPSQLRLFPRLSRLGEVSIDDGGTWRRCRGWTLIGLAFRVGEKEFLVQPRSA